MSPKMSVNMLEITKFCAKWKIVEFSLFGSALRGDVGPASDVDVLVAFADDAHWDLFNLVEMQEELQQVFGREVDLVEKGTIRNPFRRHSIMTTREILYAA